MAEKSLVVSNVGDWFFAILTLIFITLKLTGHIDWSWPWVLSPLWVPPAIILSVFAVVAVVSLIIYAMLD